MGFGLCGVTATRGDFYLDPFPGIALVMPTAPGADGLAGKEVCVCMHKASVAKALMPEMQARIHKFAPAADTIKKGSNTAEEMKDACV
ncbi:hypothetical protein NSK_006598 [Nannochloropsis salina CCMP1776]|uniref:Uncharacterized protein n=1 Tax=Nannochloropsis salina CCMP1776 TaxID=1027361 RepID=A0A4D9CRY2_9STRA|nr:hypothetical protein NSK_006598 [Nannochloropsis salina CCMP1776]|eukprot:TFJ81930.1 hypothetical protein NSK_006598 [Nannochloropsis salina CCMP1776]